MISDHFKRLYNTFLITGRKAQGLPYRKRENFDKFEEDDLKCIAMLEKLFRDHPYIDTEEFFKASYEIFADEAPFKLPYYTTSRAIKAYSLLKKTQELENADSLDSLKRLQKSFIFLTKYCIDNALQLDDYTSFSEGMFPKYLIHLKEHKINFYTLHSLQLSTPRIESEILDFIIRDFHNLFQKTKNNFFHSKKMKQFAALAFKQISDKITKQLENNK